MREFGYQGFGCRFQGGRLRPSQGIAQMAFLEPLSRNRHLFYRAFMRWRWWLVGNRVTHKENKITVFGRGLFRVQGLGLRMRNRNHVLKILGLLKGAIPPFPTNNQ